MLICFRLTVLTWLREGRFRKVMIFLWWLYSFDERRDCKRIGIKGPLLDWSPSHVEVLTSVLIIRNILNSGRTIWYCAPLRVFLQENEIHCWVWRYMNEKNLSLSDDFWIMVDFFFQSFHKYEYSWQSWDKWVLWLSYGAGLQESHSREFNYRCCMGQPQQRILDLCAIAIALCSFIGCGNAWREANLFWCFGLRNCGDF